MAPQIDNKLRRLIEPLRALGFVLKGIPRGIRIKFEKGPDVDIYTLKSNPSHIRARIKTQIADQTARERMVETIERQIADSLDPVADLHDFRLTKDSDGVFVYYAHLDMFGGEAPADEPRPSASDQSDEEDREALEATEALLDKALFEDDAEDEAASTEGRPEKDGPDKAFNGAGLSVENSAVGQERDAPEAADDISPDAIFIDDSSVEAFLDESADGPEEAPEPNAAAEDPPPAETGRQSGEEADPEASPKTAGEPEIDFSAYMEEMEAEPDREPDTKPETDTETNTAAPPTPQAVVEHLEAVDAKMLRQAMDSLALPRSSNVRLVLTRLYRSALDPEELSDSVRREAAKISTDEDRETLKMLRDMQAVNFLNPLIDLLYHHTAADNS